MGSSRTGLALNLYLALLVGVLALTLIVQVGQPGALSTNVELWIALSVLFGLTEYAALLWHHVGARFGLSASEAVLIPMLMVLSFAEVVFGVVVALLVVRLREWPRQPFREAFNVAEYGCSAAAAAATWAVLSEAPGGFTVRNTAAAVAAVVVFAVLTHFLVSGAVAIAERRSFLDLTRDVAPATLWNLGGNMTLGLFFAAALFAAEWTVLLFPIPLAALYLGYRAVVRQSRERERVESLHAASRALAASPNFEGALLGFLQAMREIVSASEGSALLHVNRQWVATSVRKNETTLTLEPITEPGMLALIERFRNDPSALIIGEAGADKELLTALGAGSLVAIPLMKEDEYAGCLLALDRVGAEEFSESDARLLDALGNELVLTLDSYRLFAQVAEERERFQKIFDGSKEGICLLDDEGVIRAWNPALARITGFQEEDILGEKWSERILIRDRYHRRIEGMDIVSVPPDEELELVTRQGPPRWVAIMSGEVQTGDDEKSWVLLVRDITAEHELEESKSDFLSTISHELRTPLTTIKGSLQVLSRPNAAANTEIGAQMIDIMKRGSDRLERLVMNLLAVSQMETGDVQVFPDEVQLEELVRSRIETILPDHPQVDVEVEGDVVVRADKERLSQVIEHLLDNARKFGPESGRIAIEIVKENGYARLSVHDEGPGIPKIDHERIFDRFVRLGHVLTRETQGPGVGLFIVKRSIEAMSGSVEVESDPNRGGATFHVRIPLAHPMAAAEPTSA